MQNCPKSVCSSSSSDHPPSCWWLSQDTVLDFDVDIVATDKYLFIIDLSSGAEFVKGFSVMKGRLKQRVSYWESIISTPRFVLDVISEGYKLPSIRVPDLCFIRNIRNNCSAELSQLRWGSYFQAVGCLLHGGAYWAALLCESIVCSWGWKVKALTSNTSTLVFSSIHLSTWICIVFPKFSAELLVFHLGSWVRVPSRGCFYRAIRSSWGFPGPSVVRFVLSCSRSLHWV